MFKIVDKLKYLFVKMFLFYRNILYFILEQEKVEKED